MKAPIKLPTIHLNSCEWFHRTTERRAQSIQERGFQLPTDPEASYQYTKGIYFLNTETHPRARSYGKASIQTCVDGTFFDLDGDSTWWHFIDQFKLGSEFKTEDDRLIAIHAAYPHVDGVKIGLGGRDEMLVIWNPDSITNLPRIRKMVN